MSTGTIRFYVDKYNRFADGMEAAFATLTPLGGQQSRSVQTMVPIGNGSNTKKLSLAAGAWLVDVRLPSGENFSKRIEVAANLVEEPLKMSATASPNESRSWTNSLSRAAVLVDECHEAGHPALPVPISMAIASPTHGIELFVRSGSEWRLYEKDWSQAGGEKGGGGLIVNTNLSKLSSQERAFAIFPNARLALAVPMPWSDQDIVIQIRAVPDQSEQDGVTLKAWVLDPHVAPILSFLEAGDLEPARMLVDQTAAWAEQLLAQKMGNPLGAAAAALALIRLREFRRLHDWPLNLANWIEWLPDGPAIAAWCTLVLGMRIPGGAEPHTFPERSKGALAYLKEAARRGAPYFSESVRLLRHVASILAHSHSDRFVRNDLRTWIEKLYQAVHPESFVAVYRRNPRERFETLLCGVRSLQAPPSHRPKHPKSPQSGKKERHA